MICVLLVGISDEEQFIAFTNGNALYPFSATPLCALYVHCLPSQIIRD
jgi:hypothetical protein